MRERTCWRLTVSVAIALAAGQAWAADAVKGDTAAKTADVPRLSAEQVIERNIAARGGAAAWRAVKTLAVSGHMDIGGNSNMEVPFRSKLKRPRKQRFELEFNGQRAVQTYDGSQGWKLRPFLGRDEAEPYSADELRSAGETQELDGPLLDYAAKGTKVALEGVEPVENHPAYRLKLTFKDGTVRRDWIDAHSFLEVKMEGAPRRLDGRMHQVDLYYRDYRAVNGLMIPYVIETAIEGVKSTVKSTHKMTVEEVRVNPKIDDSAFAKPSLAMASMPQQTAAAAGSAPGSR